jgi:hypothetical protein
MAIIKKMPLLNIFDIKFGNVIKLPLHSSYIAKGKISYRDLPDDELTTLATANDKGLISFIYDEYAPAIYGLILRRVKVIHQANEILYRTFVAFFKCLDASPFALKNTFIRLHKISERKCADSSLL